MCEDETRTRDAYRVVSYAYVTFDSAMSSILLHSTGDIYSMRDLNSAVFVFLATIRLLLRNTPLIGLLRRR